MTFGRWPLSRFRGFKDFAHSDEAVLKLPLKLTHLLPVNAGIVIAFG